MITLVINVKTSRIIYFTDDPNYAPIELEENTVVHRHEGDLPPELTLQNCWDWKLINRQLIRPTGTKKSLPDLLEANRSVVKKLLISRADEILAPYLPSSESSKILRPVKRKQAEEFLKSGVTGRYVELEARVLKSNLQEAARSIMKKVAYTQTVTRLVETARRTLTCKIDLAEAGELEELRSMISVMRTPDDCRRIISETS